MMEVNNNNDDGVFAYTEGVIVPDDVVHVRVHPSVTVIPAYTFVQRKKLEEVELCEGLLEIGVGAFMECTSLKRVAIPSTMTSISGSGFSSCDKLEEVEICDGHLNLYIGSHAFNATKLTKFRVPPLATTIVNGVFKCCGQMYSIEIPENVTNMGGYVFSDSIRNIALGSNYDARLWESWENGDWVDKPFFYCKDLNQLFGVNDNGANDRIVNALKHRFDNLPIHKMIYYQSYNNITIDQLNNATDIKISRRRSKVNPSGKQQDCLGMTPLHIMACLTVQDISLYRILIDKYPETLITEDRWGTIPLLYAVWGRAPDEIVQFLVDSYKSVYPDYVLNWTKMIETLGIAGATPRIQSLLDVHKHSFPGQPIQWEQVLDNLGVRGNCSATFGFLIKCSISKRVNAIGLKHYRDAMMKRVDRVISISPFLDEHNRIKFRAIFQGILIEYEAEYHKIKEATSLLELALWKIKLNDHEGRERQNKKMRIEESDLRGQCRISCGADIIIHHVLPYLLPSSSA